MSIQKILIVDDDDDIRSVSALAARRLGAWEVLLAATGREALDLARSEQPDVILLDVMMPGIDGPATLAMLRDQPDTREIPVIFLTAKVQRRDAENYEELGALGVIFKPFDVLTFADDIRAMVEKS